MKDSDGNCIGFRGSLIRLNAGLATLERWSEEEIKQLAVELAGLAVKKWSITEVSLATFSKYTKKRDEQPYTLAHFGGYLQGELGDLFNRLRQRILGLGPSAREEVKKFYIAYKTTTNFVDVYSTEATTPLISQHVLRRH